MYCIEDHLILVKKNFLKDGIQYTIDESNPLLISIYCYNLFGYPLFQDLHYDDEGIRINTYIDTSGRNSVDFVLFLSCAVASL